VHAKSQSAQECFTTNKSSYQHAKESFREAHNIRKDGSLYKQVRTVVNECFTILCFAHAIVEEAEFSFTLREETDTDIDDGQSQLHL
jgi:hypothetical protein